LNQQDDEAKAVAEEEAKKDAPKPKKAEKKPWADVDLKRDKYSD